MHREWLEVEQHRIHIMELWPDGPRKEAGLASARSALASLDRTNAGAQQTSASPSRFVNSGLPFVGSGDSRGCATFIRPLAA